MPKPMQRILDVRTSLTKSETAAKAVVVVGRVITDPNRSGIVQSIHGGRVIAPEGGLPRLGKTVAKGESARMIEHAIPAADRTTISERLGEIDQLIAMAETRLARLRPLAERGAVPQSQIIDLETELVGLRNGAIPSSKPGLRLKYCARRLTASLRAPASSPARSFRRRICCSKSSILPAFGSKLSTTVTLIQPH